MIIGRVRLAPGRPGFYDEMTRIHLTISNPEASIYAGTNTTNLKRSVACGILRLVSGTLDESSINKPVSTPKNPDVSMNPTPKDEAEHSDKTDEKVEELKIEEPKVKEKAPEKKTATKVTKKTKKEEVTE